MWSIDLAPADDAQAACAAVLSPEERARAARFLRSGDRARFIASHAALRLVLAYALGSEPRALAFAAGPAGKPELVGAGLAFNLSHSGDRALVGLSTQARIGCDLEALRPVPDAIRIARSTFAADEAAGLAALPPAARDRAFMAVWTRKEAIVKAIGAGLSMPLDRFSVSLPPGPATLLRISGGREEPADWTLAHLEPGPGYIGAAAIAQAHAPLRLHALPPGWPRLIG
ncbi:4'-phosphopantetheinyl transferase superfamily protein [Methylobacterium planeticum]|uniref:4'-phosphopantetheinyl transferase superfamily protein n=1 Tax=Methylobacterium planeticum TaxID=2615211 RepID=A0A6N6MPS1_9HYPH|nr:4'-phosphopantetheinyl transferase superfamily protein [Methylobacterium planeticum]